VLEEKVTLVNVDNDMPNGQGVTAISCELTIPSYVTYRDYTLQKNWILQITVDETRDTKQTMWGQGHFQLHVAFLAVYLSLS
jgi:hypothetical protein